MDSVDREDVAMTNEDKGSWIVECLRYANVQILGKCVYSRISSYMQLSKRYISGKQR